MPTARGRVFTAFIALPLVLILACSVMPGLSGLSYAANIALADPAPDLIVQNITWSPDNPSIGETVNFTVIIKNQGSGQADASAVAYCIDNAYIAENAVNPLSPGATSVKTFAWTATAGSHAIKAVADSNSQVAEGDENNNEKTHVFTTLAPDLIIQSIAWSPDSPSRGDAITFAINVKNQGNSAVSSSLVYFYIDGNSRGYTDARKINAGATVATTFTWTAKEGSHTIRAVVDQENYIVESNESNNEKTVNFTTLAPDLIIQNITWSPDNPSKNDDVTFTVGIKNQGSGRADNSHVGYYIDGEYLSSASVAVLESGASENYTFAWTAKEGSHAVKAVADYNNWLFESDETNNEKAVNFSPLAPDLLIQNITWSPESPSAGDVVTFSVTIKNQGSGKADESKIGLYIGGFSTIYQDVAEIDADAELIKTFTWTAEAGLHPIRAVADSDKMVAESDEGNNDKSVSFSTLSPDLVVQDITWSPQNPLIGDAVAYTVTIENQGNGQAASSLFAYYIDDAYLGAAYVDALDAGASANSTFTWAAESGLHTIKAVADYNTMVVEGDESNNEGTVKFSAAAPDLFVEALTWSPASPSAGDLVTFTVTIKNKGKVGADNSRVAYDIDGSSIGYQDIRAIDAAEGVTTTFTWTAVAGTHSIKAAADVTNNVTESDETNNMKAVTLPPPDIVVQGISWSPKNPSAGDVVNFTVNIKNQGSSRVGPSRITYYIDGFSIGDRDVPAIEAGAEASDGFTWTAVAGSHTIKAVADLANNITESVETNNENTVAISTLAPDLIVHDISWSLEGAEKDKDVTFAIVIKNQGNGRSGACRINYYIDDSAIGYQEVPEINAGAEVTKGFTRTVAVGSHSLRAVVDSKEVLIESDETNNEKLVDFSTISPDLVVSSITWSPASPSAGDLVTLTVAIKNEGSGTAAPSRITYYIDDSPLGGQDVPAVAAGTEVKQRFTWTAEAGSHTIKAVVDVDGYLAEVDEANNEGMASLPEIEKKNQAKGLVVVDSADNGNKMGWWWWISIGGVIAAIAFAFTMIRSWQKSG